MGSITKISTDISALPADLKQINFGNAVISPGFIDVHAHLNEPGREDWEGEWARTLAHAHGHTYTAGTTITATTATTAEQRHHHHHHQQQQQQHHHHQQQQLQQLQQQTHEHTHTHTAGITTGTTAAAKGGITTVVDMPLNSKPTTTTLERLIEKQELAREKSMINIGHWAGITPANAHDEAALKALWDGGALGFKAFMAPSGEASSP
jgi:dihydroorotase-like cyclic amidohydrolase